MFSDVIKSGLETEVVGQPSAINNVVRGVTRLASGLVPRERSLCAYLLMGPTGTGKTHLIRTLARMLHGEDDRVVTIDCNHLSDYVAQADPSMALARPLAPLYAATRPDGKWTPLEAPPMSIVQVDYLERAPQLSKSLAGALETGQIMLTDGRRGSLRNCLIFVTTGLCSGEILEEATRIGFTGRPGEEDEEDEGEQEDKKEQDRIFKLCYEQALESFGSDLLGRLDGFVIFHRLQEEHLAAILGRRVERLNLWLARRGCQCEVKVEDAAREFLLEKGARDLRLGARGLVRAHQKFVEFPMADLLVSGRIPAGGQVQVDRRPQEEHLHFTVEEMPLAMRAPGQSARRVPVS